MACAGYVVLGLMVGVQSGMIASQTEIKNGADNMTEVIQQRAYLVRRLVVPVQILFTAYETLRSENSFNGFCISEDEINSFYDPVIRSCIQKICAEKSIEPFHKVWEYFLSYKHIKREFFAQEVLVLLMMLYRDVLARAGKRVVVHQVLLRVENCLKKYCQSKSHVGNALSTGATTLYEYKKMATKYQHELSKLLVQHHIIADLQYYEEIQWQDIQDNLNMIIDIFESSAVIPNLAVNNNIRFYYIQRVLRSIFILSRYTYTVQPFNGGCDIFQHALIQECAAQIEETNNLRSLFKLWKRLASYHCIEDELLLQDFIRLVICVFGHLQLQAKDGTLVSFFERSQFKKHETTLEQLLHAYQAAVIPLGDLMDLLDEVVDQFDIFAREYELGSETLSWFDWLARYWWSIPVMFNKIMLLLVKHASSIGSIVRLA